jgi:hypothetical protein
VIARRVAPVVLGLVLLAAGAAGAAAPEMDLNAGWSPAGDNAVKVVVGVRAPLPDGAVLVFRVFRIGQKEEELPLLERRAETRGGEARGELVDPAHPLVPGSYRVTAHVDAIEAQPASIRRSIVPPLRRLQKEAQLVVGTRTAVGSTVNRLAGLILGQAAAIKRVYPEFAQVLARAWQQKLSKSEWNQWGAQAALNKGRQQLEALARTHGAGQYLPESVVRIHSLLHEVTAVCTTINDLLGGIKDRNDNMVRSLGGAVDAAAPPDPNLSSPAIQDLALTLFREGYGAYAGFAGQLLTEVEAAQAAGASKNAGQWSLMASRWQKEISDQVKLIEEFDALEWAVDRGDRKVRVFEVFAKVKDYIELCGRAKEGVDQDAALSLQREEIRRLLDGLRK